MAAGPSAEAFDGLFGRVYDFYIKRPGLAWPIGGLLWRADVGPMYEAMGAIRAAPPGATVLDAPCGGGLAFRELRPDQDVRYVALDLSEAMLERARREARRRGLDRVEIVRGDVQRLPFDDGFADLTISMNSLHCLADPAVGVAELARCTRRGGRLAGSALVLGGGRRPDRLLRYAQARGSVGRAGTRADLEGWLRAAGLAGVAVEASGAFAVFSARRPE
jgi:SAM-dependent methyltransferase